MPHSYIGNPIFKITKCPRVTMKGAFVQQPFPLSTSQVTNPLRLYQMEEEKAKKINQNKENISLNKPVFPKMQKIEAEKKGVVSNTPSKVAPNSSEKEVKLTSGNLNKQGSVDDMYSEERVALEDAYGLPNDELFNIDETDDYEVQSMDGGNYEKLNNASPTEQESDSNENDEPTETCNELKKGIDNDFIIADITTMDGLSMYEDILEGTEKKLWEDEDYENINIFFRDVYQQSDAPFATSHFDCAISKCHDEDFEEEKVQKPLNKTTSENFPMMVDFKEDDTEMDFESVFYTSVMLDSSVNLRKNKSNRQERGLSFFEHSPQMFAPDFSSNLGESIGRNRSLSKITVDEWYMKDWRNAVHSEKSGFSRIEKEEDKMEVEEPEYFKQFDSVLLAHSQAQEFVFPTIYSDINKNNEEDFEIDESDPLKDPLDSLGEPNEKTVFMNNDTEGLSYASEYPEDEMKIQNSLSKPTCF